MTPKIERLFYCGAGIITIIVVAYFAYDVYKIERRIDAKVRAHLERLQK